MERNTPASAAADGNPGLGGPLHGLRVVEIASYIAGPFAGMALGDLGAEVIKVEGPPRGDPSRYREDESGFSAGFVATNRNKKSVFLDLRAPGGRQALARLLASSDVFITSVRPRARARLGFDFDAARQLNPRLVYVSISAFGETATTRDRAGFDTIAQAQSGLLAMLGIPVNEPVRIQAMLGDQLAGTFAAMGALAALTERTRTGQGQYVRTSLLEALLGFGALNFQHAMVRRETGRPPKAVRTAGFLLEAGDGKPFALHVPPSPEHMWPRLVEALEAPELLEDPRFRTKADRDTNYEELHGLVSKQARRRPRDAWLTIMTERDIPCAPINTVEEALDDPLTEELGLLADFESPAGAHAATMLTGIGFGTATRRVVTRPPILGEHTDEVLGALDLAPELHEQLSQTVPPGSDRASAQRPPPD